jgi:hypothetical protein
MALVTYQHRSALGPDGRALTNQAREGSPLQQALTRSTDWVRAGEGDDTPAGAGPDLDGMTRDELDAEAKRHGVHDPERLPNKHAVVDAIRAA